MDADGLLRQAKITAADYLEAAIAEMKNHKAYFDQSFDNAMRLAELMATDFNTMMIAKSMDEISERLSSLNNAVERVTLALYDVNNRHR